MARLKVIYLGLNATAILILYFMYIKQAKITIEEPIEDEEYRSRMELPACQMPQFDAFHSEVRIFYKSPGKLKCTGPKKLVIAEKTRLSIHNHNNQKYYDGKAECIYKGVWRKDDGKSDSSYEIDAVGKSLSGSADVKNDYVYVECANKDDKKVVYREFFPFIQVKQDIEVNSNNNFNQWVKNTRNTVRERLNVVMVGIDSTSRLNMLRQMPKTYQYLRHEAGAIDLKGYNKVADNTFVNLVPLLSGLYLEECWNETRKRESHNYLNLIWKNFKKRGYRTFFAEDAPYISTFNYLKAGFLHQPTDYYARPLALAIEKSKMKKESKGNCFNARSETEFYLDWLTDYVDTFRKKPYFAFFFISRLTHDSLNNAGFADELYYNFFKKFYESEFNNNTVLIFFSDHGNRFGEILRTYIGKLEERMPVCMLMFPSWFKSKYRQLWKNLQINELRLTTPFDIYETLKELINFTGEERQFSISQRGISLFSEINSQRTCKDAQILPHWCTCRESREIPVSDPIVKKASNQVILTINNLLAKEEKCSKLYLSKIVDSRVNDASEKVLRFEKSKNDVIGRNVSYGSSVSKISDYLITIETTPGRGLFEGTVRYSEATDSYDVSGDISRINKYGTQSACISSAKLRMFCYCDTRRK